jgi:hypothetical protein
MLRRPGAGPIGKRISSGWIPTASAAPTRARNAAGCPASSSVASVTLLLRISSKSIRHPESWLQHNSQAVTRPCRGSTTHPAAHERGSHDRRVILLQRGVGICEPDHTGRGRSVTRPSPAPRCVPDCPVCRGRSAAASRRPSRVRWSACGRGAVVPDRPCWQATPPARQDWRRHCRGS